MKKIPFFLILAMSLALIAQERNEVALPATGNVSLPLDEYNRLVDLARKPVVKPEDPPVPYVMKRVAIRLRVTDNSVLGALQCDGDIYAKGMTRIPLLPAPAVLDVQQAGKALPMEYQAGMQTALLSGPAEFSLMLEAGMPLSIEAGRASFNLPVPSAGSAQLSLELPGEHTSVTLNPGLIIGRSSAGGRTVIEATLVPGRTTSIGWATREIAAPAIPREVRFLSNLKTLVSVSEADLRLTVLADLTVVQGEPAQFEVKIPPGFEMAEVTGATLESEELKSGSMILKLNAPAKKSHQFLISLEKPFKESKADVPLLGFTGAQRETGEILVEGEGTIELTATEGGTLKRMDVKEINPHLRSLSRNPQHAAFRFHRQPTDPPSLALAWTRFPDSSVLAAAVERAVITTLVTSEGRSLTEIKLVMKNQAQPFLKVGMPPGASIVTAEVAGEKVKPVQGTDGSRVPLLRPGFRPAGAYTVEFVLMHAGTPFAKKGDSELSLPQMDVPISLLQWEVFLPERYKVKDFAGDALPVHLLPPGTQVGDFEPEPSIADVRYTASPSSAADSRSGMPISALSGTVTDRSRAVLPGALITIRNTQTGEEMRTVANASGTYTFPSIRPGMYRVTAAMRGFQTLTQTDVRVGYGAPARMNFELAVAAVATEVEVVTTAENLVLESSSSTGRVLGASSSTGRGMDKSAAPAERPASANVLNLQRRVAGVLPISVEVPRTGNSYRFIRPLVLDEETKVTFRYKSR